jgi:hypothetical protein
MTQDEREQKALEAARATAPEGQNGNWYQECYCQNKGT